MGFFRQFWWKVLRRSPSPAEVTAIGAEAAEQAILPRYGVRAPIMEDGMPAASFFQGPPRDLSYVCHPESPANPMLNGTWRVQ